MPFFDPQRAAKAQASTWQSLHDLVTGIKNISAKDAIPFALKAATFPFSELGNPSFGSGTSVLSQITPGASMAAAPLVGKLSNKNLWQELINSKSGGQSFDDLRHLVGEKVNYRGRNLRVHAADLDNVLLSDGTSSGTMNAGVKQFLDEATPYKKGE